jgi:hypothetical protein
VRADMNLAGAPAVPALLGKRLFSLHPGLVWNDHTQRGRRLPARTFLEDAGLVRPFDMRGLLDHVRRRSPRAPTTGSGSGSGSGCRPCGSSSGCGSRDGRWAARRSRRWDCTYRPRTAG